MKNFNFLLTLIFLLLTSCGGGFGQLKIAFKQKMWILQKKIL